MKHFGSAPDADTLRHIHIGARVWRVRRGHVLKRCAVKIWEIMTTEVVSVRSEMLFEDVIDCLVRSEVSSRPVVDASGRLVGSNRYGRAVG